MDNIIRLKYDNISYIIDILTWHEMEYLKINKWKLDESTIIINSHLEHPYNFNFTKRNHLANTIFITPNSFQENNNNYLKSISIPIKFKNFNLEKDLLNFEFNDIFDKDKDEFIENIYNDNFEDLFYGKFMSYMDLKTHMFKYVVDFPIFTIQNSPIHIKNMDFNSKMEIQSLSSFLDFLSIIKNNNAFVINKKTKDIKKISKELILNLNSDEHIISMIDYSNSQYLGQNWRNLITAIRVINPDMKNFNILAIRDSWENSLFLECECNVLMQEKEKRIRNIKVNNSFDTKIKTIDLSKTMDPIKTIESSSKLNLNLMKWRMSPNLKLDELAKCKVLLLGSGTLGCNIARNLLMWGITNITFVDKGVVSYSNPIRQSLFEFNDCLKSGENRIKSIVASEAIKRILPTCDCRGVNLSIPMPGHRIDDQNISKTIEDIKILENLILDHDVSFLLTDSREARWLPTLLSSFHEKPVINVALGFDSYVIMRHGLKQQHENRMGCYFCNDIIAPIDSLSGRTIDQQCTITRPGLSGIASSIAIEILASIYNHPQKFLCPPFIPKTENNSESVIGIIPHQIRGELYNYSNMIMHGKNYDKCVACSDIMMDKLREDKYNFIIKCINENKYMEKICGLDFLNSDICGIIDMDYDI